MNEIDFRRDKIRKSLPTGSLDEANMALALALAKRGLGQTWPNPSVGAVVADDRGRIISCSWTSPGGRPHAEVNALAEAGDAARGATLFATLEPCAHWGKTPPCADAIVEAGIARVVYGVVDPDPRVSGKGLTKLLTSRVKVLPTTLKREARWLSLGHELRLTAGRPFVQIKLAVDGAGLVPAGGGGMPVWATSPVARAYAHLLRAEADAILVGNGTVLADDPDLTCRLPGLSWRSPIRVVLSTDAKFSRYARMLKNVSTAPVWIVSATNAPKRNKERIEEMGAQNISVPRIPIGRLDLRFVLNELAERGITRLLVEGGPSLAANLLAAGFADEVLIVQGFREVSGPALMPFAPFGLDAITDIPEYRLFDMRAVGADRLWIYRRVDLWER
jgi:diaminohydroxyphosphoribosylaminopyrimidine deaminase / 5-amino-6-(5-phosphoribosylamino)uracil reductase